MRISVGLLKIVMDDTIISISIWYGNDCFPGSFVLTGLVEAAAIPYLGIRIEELSLDEKAEILFLDQGYALLSFSMYVHILTV